MTRNVREHEFDDHHHEYPQKQQFLFHGHDAPPSRAAVAREQHPGRLFRARPDGDSPYADLFGSFGGPGFVALSPIRRTVESNSDICTPERSPNNAGTSAAISEISHV